MISNVKQIFSISHHSHIRTQRKINLYVSTEKDTTCQFIIVAQDGGWMQLILWKTYSLYCSISYYHRFLGSNWEPVKWTILFPHWCVSIANMGHFFSSGAYFLWVHYINLDCEWVLFSCYNHHGIQTVFPSWAHLLYCGLATEEVPGKGFHIGFSYMWSSPISHVFIRIRWV